MPDADNAAYDYGRVLDLIQRIGDCTALMKKYLPERTLGGSARTRGHVSLIQADARELSELLLARHLEIQKEVERANTA